MNPKILQSALSSGYIGGAVGGTIGGLKEMYKGKDGDVLAGIAGGSIVGSAIGLGIGAGRGRFKERFITEASTGGIGKQATEQASKVYAKNGMPNNTNDLDVAKQISKATAGDTAPIKLKNNDLIEDEMDGEYWLAAIDDIEGIRDSAYLAHQMGDRRYSDYSGNPITYMNQERQNLNMYKRKGIEHTYDQRNYDHGDLDELVKGLTENRAIVHDGIDKINTDFKQEYFNGLKESIREKLRNKGKL